MEPLHQGDILKIEKIKHPVLVASQDFFNTSGEIIGCPIISVFHISHLHTKDHLRLYSRHLLQD